MGIMPTRPAYMALFTVNYVNNIYSVIYESWLLHTVLHTILSVFFSYVFSQCLIVYQYSSSATVFSTPGQNSPGQSGYLNCKAYHPRAVNLQIWCIFSARPAYRAIKQAGGYASLPVQSRMCNYLSDKFIQRSFQIPQRLLVVVLFHRFHHAAPQMIFQNHPSDSIER